MRPRSAAPSAPEPTPAGRRGTSLERAGRGAVAIGAVALVAAAATGRATVAAAALDAGWLFFAGLAAGSVAVAAAVRVAHGRWADALLPVADAGAAFFVPASLLLVAVAAGTGAFLVPGATAASAAGLVAGELAAAAVVFGLGARLVAAARAGAAADGLVRARAVAYLVGYAVGLSVWAYGLAMRVGHGVHFTVVPALYLFGAFLSGLACVALVAAARGLGGTAVRHDVGKLLFACAAIWAYLAWSLFLPTWYGNVPADSAALLARWQASRPAAVAVLAAVAAGPLVLLFPERGKRSRATLGVAAALVLAGLWGERHLLVLPSLPLRGDAASLLLGAAVAIGVAGLFLRSAGAAMIRADHEP